MNKSSKGKKYNRIKAELAEDEKQNADLAKYMKVHASTVSDWCTNTNQPSIQDLFIIADYLQINVRNLLVETKAESKIESPWDNEMMTQAAEKDSPTIHKQKTSQRPGNKSKQKARGTK
jgi:transcriptional regulator with XRE-family HTH domain